MPPVKSGTPSTPPCGLAGVACLGARIYRNFWGIGNDGSGRKEEIAVVAETAASRCSLARLLLAIADFHAGNSDFLAGGLSGQRVRHDPPTQPSFFVLRTSLTDPLA